MDGQNAGAPLVPTDYSITYFNKLVESLSVFKPIIHCAGYVLKIVVVKIRLH